MCVFCVCLCACVSAYVHVCDCISSSECFNVTEVNKHTGI